MITNFICSSCRHKSVCAHQTTIEKFDSESKKYIGVDITIDSCENLEIRPNGGDCDN